MNIILFGNIGFGNIKSLFYIINNKKVNLGKGSKKSHVLNLLNFILSSYNYG